MSVLVFHRSCVEFPTLPLQNGLLKSFNGKLRHEKLKNTLFTTLHQARVELETRKNYYNHHSPHSGLGWLVPYEFATTETSAQATDMHAALLYVYRPTAVA
jgi:transposase InsO family protein